MILDKLKSVVGGELLEDKVQRQTATTASTVQPARTARKPLPDFNPKKDTENGLSGVAEATTVSDVVSDRKLTEFFPDGWNVSTDMQMMGNSGLQEIVIVECSARGIKCKLVPNSVDSPSEAVTLHVSKAGEDEEPKQFQSLVAGFKSIGELVLKNETNHSIVGETRLNASKLSGLVETGQADQTQKQLSD